MARPNLRDLQLFELDMLRDVKRVCESNQLKYYLSSGTLLGAVRHQGFIPWDDDIDIAMPYPDFLRFLEIGQEALGSRYFLQTADTDESFPFIYARVRRNNSTMIRYWECDGGHHGVWLDVFPLIPLGGGLDVRLKKTLISVTNVLYMSQEVFDKNRDWMRKTSGGGRVALTAALRKLLGKNRRCFAKWIRRRLFSKTEKPNTAEVWGSITAVVPVKLFREEPVSLLFEGESFSAPADFDAVLRYNYGDYMQLPPVEKRCSNHGDMYIDLERDWETVKRQGDAPDLRSLENGKA